MHLHSAPSGRMSFKRSRELEMYYKCDTCKEMPIFGSILFETKLGRHLAISFPFFLHFILRHEFCKKKKKKSISWDFPMFDFKF